MTRISRRLKIVALLRFPCAIGLLACPPIYAQLKSGTCNEYRGTLGKSTQIGMSLYAKDQELAGSYFYKKNLMDIPLAGKYTAARDISLFETDSANQPRGVFELQFPEHDPHFQTADSLQAEVLQGKWTSTDGKGSYPVYLQLDHQCVPPGQSRYGAAGATSDADVEKNAQAFYAAVVAGDRASAAKYVAYPATYFDRGKEIKISSSAEFLKVYDQIFTPALIAQIAKSIPHHMFVNTQGIMIADGKVWFDADGKARQFNNQAQ
ncbi:MAG TPA: hypothetical protein VKH45_09535 [Candidatus Acidoferrum sp.]|nr:hypothetical protein [Candidatus Acidoferrum sp.]